MQKNKSNTEKLLSKKAPKAKSIKDLEKLSLDDKIKIVVESLKDMVTNGLYLAFCNICNCPLDKKNLDKLDCTKCGKITVKNILVKEELVNGVN